MPASTRLSLLALACLVGALAGSGCARKSIAWVDILPPAGGPLGTPIDQLRVTLAADGREVVLVWGPPKGDPEIYLATSLTVDITGLEEGTPITITVVAVGGGTDFASGSDTGVIDLGAVVYYTVTLEPLGPACGNGQIDTGEQCDGTNLNGNDCTTIAPPFGGGTLGCDASCAFDTSACSMSASCGSATIESPEICDGPDLAGADCVSEGFEAGTLACDPSCDAFDATGCYDTPSVPLLRLPMNDAYLGSAVLPGSLRPTFIWEPSLAPGAPTLEYELQYGTDPTLVAGATTVMTSLTDHAVASDLTVSTVAPVGTRYYWRVRACAGTLCSASSDAWWINVGRASKDLNGDGYSDIAVSNPGITTVFVFFGGPLAFDTTPNGTILETAAGASFGHRLANGSDLNGDGFGDLVVGAPFDDTAGTNAGAAYVYFGGPGSSFDPTADGLLLGMAAGDLFGQVAAAGDTDADGYGDLVVGATDAFSVAPGAGAAYVYLGGPGSTFDTTPDITIEGAAAADAFGIVAGGGDTNGDGYADLVIGAPFADGGGTSAGEVKLYLGGPVMDSLADAVLTGAAANDEFGAALSDAGDVNGDGFSDVLVGAYRNDDTATDAGAVYLFLGAAGSTLDVTPDDILSGEGTSDQFGFALAHASDVNADGNGDIVVGAPYYDPGTFTYRGRAYVYHGSATGLLTLAGAPAGADYYVLGKSVAGAGDTNADGYHDIVVGAGQEGNDPPEPGRAHLYRGAAGSTFTTTPHVTLLGTVPDAEFGFAVAAPAASASTLPDEPAPPTSGRRTPRTSWRRRRLPR